MVVIEDEGECWPCKGKGYRLEDFVGGFRLLVVAVVGHAQKGPLLSDLESEQLFQEKSSVSPRGRRESCCWGIMLLRCRCCWWWARLARQTMVGRSRNGVTSPGEEQVENGRTLWPVVAPTLDVLQKGGKLALREELVEKKTLPRLDS